MIGRITRIELRRSAAVGVAVLCLLIGTALMLTYPQGFAGRWLQLAVTGRTMLFVLWPLALAGGAWVGLREARSRVGELFTSTVRPRWQRVVPSAGALAITVVAAYLCMMLIGAAWVVPTAGYFPVAALAVTAVGALSLVGAAWLGMAAGRAVPRLITPPVLAVVGLALVGLLPDLLATRYMSQHLPVPSALLLSPIHLAGLDDFETIVTRTSLLQLLWLAAFAATGLLLLGAVRRRAVALAVVPAVLGALVMVPLLPAGGYGGSVALDPAAVELVCDDDGAQVCMTRVHAGLLPEVVDPAREALALLAVKLPEAPGRAVESTQVYSWGWSNQDAGEEPDAGAGRHPADTLVFTAPPIGSGGRADLSSDSIVQRLIEAAWWQECGGVAEGLDTHLARRVAVAWVTGVPPQAEDWWWAEERDRVDRAYQRLVALPADEQGHAMAAARTAALDCRIEVFEAIVLDGDLP